MKEFIQEKNLPLFFDMSVDWFKERKKKGIFVEKIHYIIPPTKSKTKKIVLWHIPSLLSYMRGEENLTFKETDEELENLLKRR